jgi:hypothetical protein
LLLAPATQNYPMCVSSVASIALERFEEIVPLSNAYDIGLYLLPPSSFNNLHALPSKFFEFLQALLAIAIGPFQEMARIVREFRYKVVAGKILHRLLLLAP